MALNTHDMEFKTSRDLRSALVAALEKALNGKLDPVKGRRLISAAKIFNAELDRKVSILTAQLHAKDTHRSR
jgi:hypothetical protein